jgi:DinB family protein
VGARQLEEYRRQFERIQAEAKDLTTGLTEAQFNWRPAPDSWSIEECLGHLTSVGHWEVRAIEKAVDDGHARGLKSDGPFTFGPIERFIIGMTQPPVRQKLPAPRQFVPAHGQPLTAVLPTFLHVQSQFIHQIDRAAGLDLIRVKVQTPISRFLRLSLGAMLAQAAAHERRHMDQAWRVREKLPA